MKTIKTIDITPTWEALLPAMLAVLQSGTYEAKQDIRAELRRMAKAADMQVAAEKDRNLTWSMDNYPPKWERPVLLALVKAILKRDLSVTIYCEGDYDDPVIEGSTDLEEIVKNLAAGDLDKLTLTTSDGMHSGYFYLIYNNGSEHEPMVVISDYSARAVCNEIYAEVEQEVES